MTKTTGIAGISALVDALGVVLARLIVVCCIAIFIQSPFLTLAYFFIASRVDLSAFTAAFFLFSYLSFAGIAIYLGVDAIKSSNKGLQLTVKIIGSIAVIGILPIGLFIRSKKDKSYMIFESHYLNENKIKSLLFLICGFNCFVMMLYALGKSSYAAAFFEHAEEIDSIKASFLFALDIATRGFFFDLPEHFNLHVSSIHQNSNLLGLLITFTLRLSSTALAVSIIIELLKSMKGRLDLLEQSPEPVSEANLQKLTDQTTAGTER